MLSTDYEVQTCKIEVDGLRDLTYTVEGFGNDGGRITHWTPDTSIEEMMVWVGEARSEFNNLGIGNINKNITINIETLVKTLHGYVNNSVIENAKTLHLNKDKSYTDIQGTIAHEYFHYAQFNTKFSYGTGWNIGSLVVDPFRINTNEKLWLIESTAEWFTDYLYDKKNYYLNRSSIVLNNNLRSIMEIGGLISVNKNPEDYINYRKMMMIKLFSEKCNNFELEISHLFFGKFFTGYNGIENTIDFLNSPSVECNFGNLLGDSKKSSLDTALLYYMYATRQEKNINLIDSTDEKQISFAPIGVHNKSRWGKTLDEKTIILSYNEYKEDTSKVLPYSAFSFKLKHDDIKDTNKTQITLSIKTNNPLTVVGLHLDKDGKGIASRLVEGAFNRMGGDFNFTTEAGVVKEYVLTEENAKGGLFITLLNATGKYVNISDINITSRFERDDENNIVIDHKTNLMWQDEADTWLDSWYGARRHCTALTLGDYNDWRVPTYDELIHILDLDGEDTYRYEIFEHLGPVGYWSLELNGGVFPNSESAKVVNFGLATWIWINTSQNMNTRCVRTK